MSLPPKRKAFGSSDQRCGNARVNREVYSAFVTIFCYRPGSEICPHGLMTSTPSPGLHISLRAQSASRAIVPWAASPERAGFRQDALANDAARFGHGMGGKRSNPRCAGVLSLTDIARHTARANAGGVPTIADERHTVLCLSEPARARILGTMASNTLGAA
jgi:hypothetical protein